MTKLINLKTGADYDILIDRTTIFGNPFTHLKHKKTLATYIVPTRADAIIAYKKYFYKRIAIDETFKKEILSLKDKILGCHCYPPLACHGLIIIEYLDGNSSDKS